MKSCCWNMLGGLIPDTEQEKKEGYRSQCHFDMDSELRIRRSNEM